MTNVKLANIIELCTYHTGTGIFLHHYWSGGGLMNVGIGKDVSAFVLFY
jgi:hypothetical protein